MHEIIIHQNVVVSDILKIKHNIRHAQEPTNH